MNRKISAFAGVFLALGLLCMPAQAQAPGAKPIFTYVDEWGVPREMWGEMAKVQAEDKAVMDALVADGTLLGYGNFQNRVHSEGGYTHGSWFVASSVGNVLKALEKIYSRGGVAAPVLAASKHQDYLMMSTVYGGKAVSNSTGYLRVLSAELLPGQADKFTAAYTSYLKPVYDKLVADGTLLSYQLDMEWNVQNAPGRFFSAVVVRDAAALDKMGAAFNELFAGNPAILDALVSNIVPNSRQDLLAYISEMTRK